jgi:hypothetical protein
VAFPADPLPIRVDLSVNGTWTDITSYVYQRDDVTISRGRSDEQSDVGPSSGNLTVNNRDGRFSPRNPVGAWYGQWGRNSSVRISTADQPVHLSVPETKTSLLSTPDSAGLSITGDIDIRVDMAPDHGWSGELRLIAGKYDQGGNQRCWAVAVQNNSLMLFWSADGATRTVILATEALRPSSNRVTIRVTLDVNNGAGGNDLTFYTGTSVDGPWTQLGDTITTSGTTSFYDSTADLTIGHVPGLLNVAPCPGQYFAFQLYSGIGGTLKADLDLSTAVVGAATVSDGLQTWTLRDDAEFEDIDVRMVGELSSVPQMLDRAGRDAHAKLEVSGIFRRLGQGAESLASTLRRGILGLSPAPVAYWPMEDGSESLSFGAGISGVRPMSSWGGPVQAAQFTGFAASEPIPNMNGAQLTGWVPNYASTGAFCVRFLMYVTDGSEPPSGQTLVSVTMSGTIVRAELIYGTGGTLQLKVYSVTGAVSADTGAVAFNVDGKLNWVSLDFATSGSHVTCTMSTLEQGQTTGGTATATATSESIVRCTGVIVSPAGGITTLAIGHMHVRNEVPSLFDLATEFNAWVGETAGVRVLRLCDEEQLPLYLDGYVYDTPVMGPQRPMKLLDLLRECQDVDGGVLFEPRRIPGIGYRTRRSILNQSAAVTLDYSASELADTLDPSEDDQALRNDVTVKRTNGSSARSTVVTGPLSSLAPPDGVGRYTDDVTINVQSDEQLEDQAGWRSHVGTVDEARYPSVAVNLGSAAMLANPTAAAGMVGADIGDLVRITNPPAGLPPDDIDVIVQGTKETLTAFERRIEATCSPGGAWTTAVWDASVSRWDTAGASLSSAVTSTGTTLVVDTTSGPTWSTTSVPYDVEVAGEQMTVTAVGGTSSPQTITVTRSVNGVVKAQAAGALVRLWVTGYYSI